MKPDEVQWKVVSALVSAHPDTVTVDELCSLGPGDDIEESIARLLIDGLAIRFGDWVKASEPAARFDELTRYADGDGSAGAARAAWNPPRQTSL